MNPQERDRRPRLERRVQPYKVAYADVQGHRAAAGVDAEREATTEAAAS